MGKKKCICRSRSGLICCPLIIYFSTAVNVVNYYLDKKKLHNVKRLVKLGLFALLSNFD